MLHSALRGPQLYQERLTKSYMPDISNQRTEFYDSATTHVCSTDKHAQNRCSPPMYPHHCDDQERHNSHEAGSFVGKNTPSSKLHDAVHPRDALLGQFSMTLNDNRHFHSGFTGYENILRDEHHCRKRRDTRDKDKSESPWSIHRSSLSQTSRMNQ